jgi:lipoate-protein ligase B
MWSVFTNRHTPEHPFHFQDLLELQARVLQELQARVLQELQAPTLRDPQARGDSALLLAELPPTLTLGARQLQDPGVLAFFQGRITGVDLVPGERGGNETWHGPGQWVGFVLTRLDRFTGDPKGVRRAVHRILELLLPVAQQYVPNARIEEGARLGIWSDRGKIASIGIKIRNGYTSSGFALNCIPRREAFQGVDPCGIAGAAPDFLFRESVRPEQWDREFEKIPGFLWESFKNS